MAEPLARTVISSTEASARKTASAGSMRLMAGLTDKEGAASGIRCRQGVGVDIRMQWRIITPSRHPAGRDLGREDEVSGEGHPVGHRERRGRDPDLRAAGHERRQQRQQAGGERDGRR